MLLARHGKTVSWAARGSLSLLSLLLLPALAGAQTTSPLLKGPGEDRPELAPRKPAEAGDPFAERTLPPIEIPEQDPTASALSGGTIRVESFVFTGNSVISDEQLQWVTRPYVGEGRRYSALLEARDRVTRAYVDSGYISSGAKLPPQSFDDGVVEIVVVEGLLTKVEIENTGRLRDRYLESRLRTSDGPLNVNDLRESLRLLKRDPLVDAVTAELYPGEERGTSVLSIVVDEAVPVWAGFSADNYAPEAVGGTRGRMRLGHRNLTGWGDSIHFGYSVAEGLNDLDIQFQVPLTRYATTLDLWTRLAWSEIVESEFLEQLDIRSNAQGYGFSIRQPVLRRRGQEARVFFAGDWKKAQSFLLGERGIVPGDPNSGRSAVAALRVGGDYLLRLQNRALAAWVSVNFGLDALDSTKEFDGDLPGETRDAFPDGKFVSARFRLQEIEYLPWYDLRVQTRIDAQVSNDRLLGLEQFAAGGHASVRGFRENLIVRDQGVAGSIELRIPAPPLYEHLSQLELGIFADVGYGRDRGGESRSATIVGLGLGLHADFFEHFRVSLEWATDVEDSGAVIGNELQDDGFHFSVLARFP